MLDLPQNRRASSSDSCARSAVTSDRDASRAPRGIMVDDILRKLARDQWVRFHGTPRITVLVGGVRARALWRCSSMRRT